MRWLRVDGYLLFVLCRKTAVAPTNPSMSRAARMSRIGVWLWAVKDWRETAVGETSQGVAAAADPLQSAFVSVSTNAVL